MSILSLRLCWIFHVFNYFPSMIHSLYIKPACRDPSVSSGPLHLAEVATQENFCTISPYPLANAPHCHYSYHLWQYRHHMLVRLSMPILYNSPDVLLEWHTIVAIHFQYVIDRGFIAIICKTII